MNLTTDVLVIGAGPAGYVGAIKLGKLGKKVVLVEGDKLGGECLNYGCIPSKALINAGWLYHRAAKGLQPGVDGGSVTSDLGRLQAWKSGLLGAMAKNIGSLAKANGVEALSGKASFTGPNEARVVSASGESTVRFTNALIATGTRPASLPCLPFDGAWCLTNREALELAAPPPTLLVVGAGAIGLELGTFYAKLGSKVTVVEFMPQILPGMEADAAGVIARNLARLGVEVLVGSKAKSVLAAAGPGTARRVLVETPEGEKTVEAHQAIVSVGRVPVTEGLGLEAAGVKTDAKGHIAVDATLATSCRHIYAAGDVARPPYLAHKASAEALAAAYAIAGASAPDLGLIPMAVFTDPEAASVGESEAAAKSRGAEVLTGKFPFSASGRAQTMRETDGFVKVVADKATHKLLGASMVGPHACELISEACLGLRLGARLEDVAHTMHPHPTLPEAFMEACEAALGQAIHLLPPRTAKPG
ncbi:MAG: dihydrolipoyl dehydrogenase [Elusimicrobia bacterium]|nr:dihydrolipoyl dehydrogenase [Elusimicrobiota bacterium]